MNDTNARNESTLVSSHKASKMSLILARAQTNAMTDAQQCSMDHVCWMQEDTHTDMLH